MASVDYRKTKLELVVLSNGPIPEHWELGDVLEEGNNGNFVIGITMGDAQRLTRKEMRDELILAGNDGEFFEIDEELVAEDQEP